MEFNKVVKEMWSEVCGEDVVVLEYKSKDKVPYCPCDRCGKSIVSKLYQVQSKETDGVRFVLGSECIKHLF